MRNESSSEIELNHFEQIRGQITHLQALFRQFEDLEVEQLKFRELFRVCFL